MKSFKVLMGKLFKREKRDTTLLEKNKVRSSIENLCREYLVDFDDVLTFEALPKALDSTLAVVTEPALTSKYEFYQAEPTIFCVRLKELDIL